MAYLLVNFPGDVFILFVFKFFFNWRIIALQNFLVFCQTSTWMSHRYTYIPSLLNLPPMESHITKCKLDSQWEFAVWLRKLKQELCINLDGWDGEGNGREVQKRCLYFNDTLSWLYLLVKFAQSVCFNKHTYLYLESSNFLPPGKPSALMRKVKHSRNSIFKHFVLFFKMDSF